MLMLNKKFSLSLSHKCIDDITISESISYSNVSVLQTAVDKVNPIRSGIFCIANDGIKSPPVLFK